MFNKLFGTIALSNISRRKQLVAIVSICIIISVFLFVLVWGTLDATKAGLKLNQERHGADVVVYPLESKLDDSEILYSGVAQSVYMPEDIISFIDNQYVEDITTQYFLQTLPLEGCCSVESELRLVGVDWESDFMVRPWVGDKSISSLNEGQVIVGCNVDAYGLDFMTILNNPMRIIATLEPTGSFLDESVICNMNQLRRIASVNYHFEDNPDPYKSITCAMIRLREDAPIDTYLDSINGISANVISVSDLQIKLQHEIGMFSTILTFLLAVILILCIIAISSQFYMMIHMRIKEVGYLRSIGMTRSQLFRMFIMEFGLIGLLSGFFGSLIGMALISPMINWVKSNLTMPVSSVDIKFMFIHLLIGIVITLLLCLISTVIPLMITNRLSPHEMITKGEL